MGSIQLMRNILRMQLSFLFGLLFWIGVWDAADAVCSKMSAADLQDWLGPVIMIILGLCGLAFLIRISVRRDFLRAVLLAATDMPPAANATNSHWACRSLVGLAVLFFSLIVYVGLWDLIDNNLLSKINYCANATTTDECTPETTTRYLVVRLALTAVAALGLLGTGGLADAADGFMGEDTAVMTQLRRASSMASSGFLTSETSRCGVGQLYSNVGSNVGERPD
jgi:hypothetical protein